MSQSRTHSLVETMANVASGFVISALFWEFVVKPVWALPTSTSDNLAITSCFTVLSIARGYVWRRLGNWLSTR